jgi:hypothetical protein
VAWVVALAGWVAVLRLPAWSEAEATLAIDSRLLGEEDGDAAAALRRLGGEVAVSPAQNIEIVLTAPGTVRLRTADATSDKSVARLQRVVTALAAEANRLAVDAQGEPATMQALAAAQAAARDAQARREALERELAAAPRRVSRHASSPPPVPAGRAVEIAVLEQRLQQLRNSGPDDHPDMIATRRTLAALQRDPLASAGGRMVVNPAITKIETRLAVARADHTTKLTALAEAE